MFRTRLFVTSVAAAAAVVTAAGGSGAHHRSSARGNRLDGVGGNAHRSALLTRTQNLEHALDALLDDELLRVHAGGRRGGAIHGLVRDLYRDHDLIDDDGPD